MDIQEAKEWLEGKRSMTNIIPTEPFETWQSRIAEADANKTKQAYYIVKAQAIKKALSKDTQGSPDAWVQPTTKNRKNND
jgi:hypothetical protein